MMNPMNRHSPIRMMGLASGMDTDMIIQQTLRMHQFRIDNRTRDRTILEWRQETHNSLRDEIRTLQNNFMTASNNALHPLLSRRTFNSTVANITGANASAVSIRTNTSTPTGSMRINSVESIARGAGIASASSVSAGGVGFTPTNRLDSLRFADGGRINFQSQITNSEGQTVTVDQADWEQATANANWSSSTATLNLPTPEGHTGGNPQVTRNSDGTIAISFNGDVLATLPAQSDGDPENDNAGAVPMEHSVNFTFGDREFVLARAANGAVTVRDYVPTPSDDAEGADGIDGASAIVGANDDVDGVDGDDATPAPAPPPPVNINLNNLTFTQTATVNVNGTDVAIERRVNFAGAALGPALVTPQTPAMVPEDPDDPNSEMIQPPTPAAAAPAFSSTFSISNVVNGQLRTATFNVNSGESITSLMERVNRSNLGVTMSYNRLTDRFSIESNTPGSILGGEPILDDDGNQTYVQVPRVENGEFVLDDQGNTVFDTVPATTQGLIITDGAGGNMLSMFGLANDTAERTQGSMAVAYINGERVESATNTFQFRGLDITLNSATEPGSAPIDVNFQRNTDDAVAAIRSFIDAYNTFVSRLETLTSERQSRAQRSYRPLTDEEKQGMTERQVDEWQRVARIGIMRNDNALERLAFGLRREFFNNIEGMGISASQIGLTTGAHRDGTGGQIMIDEERLRAALERDPEMVADIFSKIQTNPETGRSEGVGLIHRLNDRFSAFATSQRNSLESLENSLRRTNEQIERMQIRMFAEEDRLFRQFAAMEGAMSGMQNQGQWMTAMLGSM